MDRLVMSGTVDKVTDVLLALIARHGNTISVMEAITKEQSNGKEQ